MKEPFKKKIIVSLLFISCFISGYILTTTPGRAANQLQSFAQVDSLIHQELKDFNIGPQQIEKETIVIDSNFSRKVYHVEVSPYLSKTQLHAELNNVFYDFSVHTPGRVLFPEKNIKIHLLLKDTIIRTIYLKAKEE